MERVKEAWLSKRIIKIKYYFKADNVISVV